MYSNDNQNTDLQQVQSLKNFNQNKNSQMHNDSDSSLIFQDCIDDN